MNQMFLVHGGLWENTGSDWFWRGTGVARGLEARGFTVIAPDRICRAADWGAEARHLATAVAGAGVADADPAASAASAASAGVAVVAGSFGCAAAARLALDFPRLVRRLVLAWPASLADQFTARRFRAELSRQGAPKDVLHALLGTWTLPSAADAELGKLEIPVGIVPSAPPNPVHPRAAVDMLLRLLPDAVELPGSPEAPRPEFPPHLESFLDSVAAFARD